MDEIVIEIIDNPQEKDIDIIKGELRKVIILLAIVLALSSLFVFGFTGNSTSYNVTSN